MTDPSRYARLHAVADVLLADLEIRFAVRRESSTEPDRHGDDPACVVRLVPVDPAAGALTVVFDAFPGLLMRLDDRDWLHLPLCGCDACDEAVEECTETLHERVDALVAGTTGERLTYRPMPGERGWWHETWYRTDGGGGSGLGRVEGEQLAELRRALPTGHRTFAPWPERR